MSETVVRVELTRATFQEMKAIAGGPSIGLVVIDALRRALPVLTALPEAPLAKGSNAKISVHPELQAGLAAFTRALEGALAHHVQIAMPAELWRQIDRERTRLGLTVNRVVAWAWKQARHPQPQ
jgi:hypothetical protein